MKFMHAANAFLWLANAVVWAVYAGVPFMTGASLAAAGVSAYLWWSDA
jgi:hypothetical protein